MLTLYYKKKQQFALFQVHLTPLCYNNKIKLIIYFMYLSTRVYNEEDNIRTEPKFITFFTQLLILFKFCHFCHEPNPLVETLQIGTMAEVRALCVNPKCGKEFIWKSQPVMPATKIPAGNFLLCFSILVAGGSASKVFQIFKHMGLACISLNTFFEHQRVSKAVYSNCIS